MLNLVLLFTEEPRVGVERGGGGALERYDSFADRGEKSLNLPSIIGTSFPALIHREVWAAVKPSLIYK